MEALDKLVAKLPYLASSRLRFVAPMVLYLLVSRNECHCWQTY